MSRLRRAEFLNRHESITDLVQQLAFIGKHIDSEGGLVHNKQGIFVGIIILWLRTNIQPFSHNNRS